ncbi:MAG: ABC transporter permease [Chitinophagales bacterium]
MKQLGRYFLMLSSLFSKPEKYSMYWKETVRQMNAIGVGSLLIVGVISIFVGAVTAIQFAYQMQDSYLPTYMLGFIVRDTMIIELAPTLSCLVLAGKVGSNIASELGTMRITEQIDALEIMGINSANYLISPKLVASVLIVPPLIVIAAFMGIYGGFLSAQMYGISPSLYRYGLLYLFDPFNGVIMIVKAIVFAFLITSVACYEGFYVKGGAIEIARASTRAVVHGSILVIFFDYILATILT